MKNTIRDWIQAAAAKVRDRGDDAADPGRGPAEARQRRVPALRHLRQLGRRVRVHALRSSTHAAAAGAWRSAAASAMYSGARAGSARNRSHREGGSWRCRTSSRSSWGTGVMPP
jgi:hypothetical protein